MIKTSFFRKTHFLGLILITLFACGKTNEFSLSEERDKILALHNLQRDYHFNKDSIAFANQFSDDFVSVNKGVIAHPSKEETITRYNGYFSSVEFVKWDDLSEPIIKFSDDGSMAYTIVDKIVSITFQDENGETQSGETHFAWTAIYKKYGDNWKIAAVTSTEVPSN
ncbi:nuclear transport factor 2 family protein [Roseivirga sp. E12]|uniref:nuclear transport factor 2 family protein n=1 Tax=Roseivirga sp. E12 TaxID=2819237 RepID=UPI001ABC5785|nr:nuclear transport factor 2 family protein [Roseivirga sp. E12]MBO3698155.1 nuclear transport factor 2 family protein [Roseivirga sp. E12]